MKVLGISLGHDTNFCLVEDGEVKAVSEAERFFRQKRYKLHCLTLEEKDVDSGFQYTNVKELKQYLKRLGDEWGYEYDCIGVQNQLRQDIKTY